jgi:hypothetical protein
LERLPLNDKETQIQNDLKRAEEQIHLWNGIIKEYGKTSEIETLSCHQIRDKMNFTISNSVINRFKHKKLQAYLYTLSFILLVFQ